MKHIIPILTLALLGAAATVSAGEPYTEASFLANEHYTEKYDSLVSPIDINWSNKNGTYDFGDYTVTLDYYSYLKIHAKKDINLYIYDFVDHVLDGNNSASALNGTNPVVNIGYREIDSTTGEAVPSSEKIHPLGAPTDSEVVKMNKYNIVRNSYYLGEFTAGKDYELYVEYATPIKDNRPWSYTTAPGSNGPGGGILADNDKLMTAYFSHAFDSFEADAVAKSYRYAALVQVNSISFGLRSGSAPDAGGTFGAPLPGGLQIALIAGLFGLGFWYIRRRKSIAA